MTGAVSVTCVVLIPLRYQTAAGLSPLQAGARLVLFSVFSPLGAIVAASLCKNKRVPPLYLMLFGEFLQILGLVLVTTLTNPEDRDWPGLYGLQVCIGFGMGFVMGTATLLTPAIAERKDLGEYLVAKWNSMNRADVHVSGRISSRRAVSVFRRCCYPIHCYCSG